MAAEDSSRRDGLAEFHDILMGHFTALRAKRDALAPDLPMFALEHPLSDTQLILLNTEVCGAVRSGRLPHGAWLPFVVYAAEIGYEYAGEEYWQTFEARTPSWAERGDRYYIRRQFQNFAATFRGAEPSGAWAHQFSIICWPITHAVLPTDLQRQLASLLFEYRTALTSELLHNPAELGQRLAGRAWQASSRFQNFAQNTELLGQVAVALLTHDDEESPFLLTSTLRRIVADLSEEREARRWLRDAKVTASQVRLRGVGHTEIPSGTVEERERRVRLPAATDPDLHVRNTSNGWSVYLEFPDLTALAERLSEAYDELGRLRGRVAGVHGAPLARGRLLVSGQRIRLDEWPPANDALITLENGSSATNSLLREQCVMPSGPRWLFRLADPYSGEQVRGRMVRPGRRYLLLSRSEIAPPFPSWVQPAEMETSGVYGYALAMPAILGDADVAAIATIGLSAVTDIDVRPVGFAAALWDGEGTAEWNAGEDPIIAVSSPRELDLCVVALDGEPYKVAWPSGSSELFLQLRDLSVGTHDLRISLLTVGADHPLVEGLLQVLIRTPPTPRATGTFRHGLTLVAAPMNPTLTELWDGAAALEMSGPRNVSIKVTFELRGHMSAVLARHTVSVRLPVTFERWPSVFNQLKRDPTVERTYEQAESCSIRAAHPELGSVVLRAEREFTPLRWVFRRDSDGPAIRLIDNTDGGHTHAERRSFRSPDRAHKLQPVTTADVRDSGGGLFTAEAAGARVSVILPPFVHTLDDLRRMNVLPTLSPTPRSSDGMKRLITLAELWGSASLPGDPFGQMRRFGVLRSITSHLVGTVGGGRWQELEDRLLRDDTVPLTQLRDGVGMERYQQQLAADLSRQTYPLAELEAHTRAEGFAAALRTHARQLPVLSDHQRFAEFLLRLASDPPPVRIWAGDDLDDSLALVLTSPVLLRAARYVVLAVSRVTDDDTQDVLSPGWVWV